jgi:hypothetical protein
LKKTAVELLEISLLGIVSFEGQDFAKEMEKEQIIDAVQKIRLVNILQRNF